ncbi:MAG: hypothetical protein ACRDPB_04750, partial [Nocardioidaceae bacterium]
MPLFALLSRRRTPPTGSGAAGELPEDVRTALPMRFEAVGEALTGPRDPQSPRGSQGIAEVRAACAVVGRDVARDGAALGEALSGLRTTYE